MDYLPYMSDLDIEPTGRAHNGEKFPQISSEFTQNGALTGA